MTDLFDTLMQFDRYKEREGYIRAPFGWAGGKTQSLKHLIPLLPQGKIFVDACGGSGVITINAPNWYQQKVFNDKHAGVTAFYRCIRDRVKMNQLADRLLATPHSREEFVWCKDTWENHQDDVERAARWYYMTRVSFAALGRNFGRATNGSNMIARKLRNGLELFPIIHQVFVDDHVLVENMDVLQCMSDFDSHDTVHYIDPDYIGSNPIYEHTVDHKMLLERVFEMRGWVAVSGYANPLYDSQKWDYRYSWEVSVPLTSNAFNEENGLANKANVMHRETRATEVLWVKDFS